MANWDGMKQALEAYHQDMRESGKDSSLNAVQLWDDLHSTLTSLNNKFIPSKLSNLIWVNQKLKRIARQRDSVFQKHRKSGKPADRKSPSNVLINPTFRVFLMWPQMILLPNPIQKKSLPFSNIPNKILPLLHLYENTILSIRTTPRKPLFLMNSSSLILVGSLITASSPFVTWNYKKVLMQTDPC